MTFRILRATAIAFHHGPTGSFGFDTGLFAVNGKLVALDIGEKRRPVQLGRVDARFLDGILLRQFFEETLFGSNKVHAIDNFENPQLIQCVDNIFRNNRRALGNVHNTERIFIGLVE